MARVISLNVGMPAALVCPDRTVTSAIRKAPVAGQVRLAREGLDGDRQADLVNHGGADKAICAYPSEHLPYWSARLGRTLGPAAFGENLSTEGLLERDLHLGAAFHLGSALVQVSQPRGPCFKLAALNGEPHLAQWVQSAGFTGFYFRCLEPGNIKAGDTFSLVDPNERAPTIADAVRVQYTDRDDHITLERLAACATLAEAWRSVFAKRLAGLRD
ncbi:MAG TPA: MOSC domain-containing protein [Stellaceae bacterium]|nr:MOSC domain-containing protein [Stellaceae bacterium]